jgi:hypothetical protein
MTLTNAQKQARWRERRNALARANPEAVERALLEEAARCEQLSAEQRVVLADRLADLANRHLWRAHKLARVGIEIRERGTGDHARLALAEKDGASG